MKKSQITIFLVLGIIILIVFGMAWMVSNRLALEVDSSVFEVPEEIAPFEAFIQECLEQTTDRVLYKVMQEGGQGILRQSNDEKKYVIYENKIIPIYYRYDGATPQNYIAPISQLEQEISYRISSEIGICLSGFEHISRTGYELIMRPYSIETIITDSGETRVIFVTNFTLKREDFSYTTRDFTYGAESNILFFLLFAEEIIEEIKFTGNNSFQDLFALFLSREYNITFTKVNNKDSTIYLLLEKKSTTPRYYGSNDTFNFALQYDWKEIYNPYYHEMHTYPPEAEFEFILNETFAAHLRNNFTEFMWDITSYFPGYNPPGENPDADTHWFLGYSQEFDVNYKGEIYPYFFPIIGENKILAKAFTLANTEEYELKKFIIHARFEEELEPIVYYANESIAFRGFNHYERITALNHDGSPVTLSWKGPEELLSMKCDGYLILDENTGEMYGYITADPGIYTLEITAHGTKTKEFNKTLIITGDYELDCE